MGMQDMRMYSSECQMVVNTVILRLRESWWAWRDLSPSGPVHKFPQSLIHCCDHILIVPPWCDWSGYSVLVGMASCNSVNMNVWVLESAHARAMGQLDLFYCNYLFIAKLRQPKVYNHWGCGAFFFCSVTQVLQAPPASSPSPVSLEIRPKL